MNELENLILNLESEKDIARVILAYNITTDYPMPAKVNSLVWYPGKRHHQYFVQRDVDTYQTDDLKGAAQFYLYGKVE